MLFDYIKIQASVAHPYVLAIKGKGSYTTYGFYFRDETIGGIVSSSGFDKFPTANLAVGAYYIDTSSLDQATEEILIEGGPAINPELSPLTIQLKDNLITFRSMVEAIEFESTLKPLTQISIDIAVQIFRSMGSRIGRFDGQDIQWEKGFFSSSNQVQN